MNGIIKPSTVKGLEEAYHKAVKELNPYVNDIIEGFDLPKIP